MRTATSSCVWGNRPGRGRHRGDRSHCVEARAGREDEREAFRQDAEQLVLADLARALAERRLLDQLAAAEDQRALRVESCAVSVRVKGELGWVDV